MEVTNSKFVTSKNNPVIELEKQTKMSANSYSITKDQYNYLLPVFGLAAPGPSKLLCRTVNGKDYYSFIGTNEDFKDMMARTRYM